ncbi:MAG: hypothetical protein JSW64_09685 [Candidatus Zixiibacteriota bacterium]|nr:MAG: hypothetical protein JSW64_09685 [candidate division Zixibacteria bacterium]
MLIIRTDSMKIRDDFKASLKFVDDITGQSIFVGDRIDSAGYRYRSFWVSNTSYNKPSLQIRYDRDYPSDTTFRWWDGQTANCMTTFLRDSLYVVGGSLSVDCSGVLSPIENINNSFAVNTDTVINDTARATKLIIVDRDPPNLPFFDSLGYDILRAIGWKEGAGSNDTTHCRPYNHQWNNYWDHVVTGQDTCFETLFPCENIKSTATGTMQMLRSLWEPIFNGSNEQYQPQGYFISSWDSLAWNWKINIFNGKWIYFVDTFYHINLTNPPNPQRNWDSLYFPASDYTPDSTNKEDIATYGYYQGVTKMKKIKTQEDWDNTILKNDYVVNVRRFKDTMPWLY